MSIHDRVGLMAAMEKVAMSLPYQTAGAQHTSGWAKPVGWAGPGATIAGRAQSSATAPATTPAEPAAPAPEPQQAEPTPAPAPQAPAQQVAPQYDPNAITPELMRKYRKYTAANNMGSDMDKWKTWQAMQGNRNASNADYNAWKAQQTKSANFQSKIASWLGI